MTYLVIIIIQDLINICKINYLNTIIVMCTHLELVHCIMSIIIRKIGEYMGNGVYKFGV
jgi:hypothetical protein